MVTMKNAENALKTVYLGVVANQLNTTINPLYNMIKHSTKDVWGKEVRKLAPYGINGGVAVGEEDGDLPAPDANRYVQFCATLKNIYGQISISDKAIRASASNEGAFVNLLNSEMEGLLDASRLYLGRMIFGDGDGLLGQALSTSNNPVASASRFRVGMNIEVWHTDQPDQPVKTTKLTDIISYGDYERLVFEGNYNSPVGSRFVLVGVKGLEISGLERIFRRDSTTLYGLSKADYGWLSPRVIRISDGTNYQPNFTELNMQNGVDLLEERAGSTPDIIVCNHITRRSYIKDLTSIRRNIDVQELNGGFKAISFGGIPVVADRFCTARTMYFLNSKDFCLHQLCDWEWLESENGKVLHQNAGKPTYNATLVKYAELICDRPGGQLAITSDFSFNFI